MLNKTQKRAIRLLKSRVQYENAAMRLPGTPFPQDDTEIIRKATKLYVDTWVIPILEALEDGDTQALKQMVTYVR